MVTITLVHECAEAGFDILETFGPTLLDEGVLFERCALMNSRAATLLQLEVLEARATRAGIACPG